MADVMKSALKWTASASMAGLLYFRAILVNALDRCMSQSTEAARTATAQMFGCITTLLKNSLSTTSLRMRDMAKKSRSDSVKAARFSALPWP